MNLWDNEVKTHLDHTDDNDDCDDDDYLSDEPSGHTHMHYVGPLDSLRSRMMTNPTKRIL